MVKTYEKTAAATTEAEAEPAADQKNSGSTKKSTAADSGADKEDSEEKTKDQTQENSGSSQNSQKQNENNGQTAGSAEYYGTYQGAAFSVNTMDQATVTVSIDELDILSVEKGQTARNTLDALEDQEFEGTVTKVSNTASTSNGNTKYDVEISVPLDENMLDGLSATVIIVTDSVEDAVMIPVLALQERGEKQFVYTSQDKNGNLSGETEVETGLSDGNNVEIKSGLSDGDTIYYQLASGDETTDMRNLMMQGGGPGGENGRPDMGGNEKGGPGQPG